MKNERFIRILLPIKSVEDGEMEDVEGAVARKRMREAESAADILDPSTKAFCCCIFDRTVLSLHKHIVTDFLKDKLIAVYGNKGRVVVGLPICCAHFADGHGKRIRSAARNLLCTTRATSYRTQTIFDCSSSAR